MLRNVALVDKWDAVVEQGDDVPLAAAYCAHLHATGEPLEVEDVATDARVPWMSASPIVSYCGAVILDLHGQHWGALCHFDVARCDSKNSDKPLLVAAARMIYQDAVAAA
nr:GAF domain-containing protein [Ramlibacter ginsenosidimutans]